MHYTVKLPFNPLWQASAWAQKHCPSYIGHNLFTEPTEEGGISFITNGREAMRIDSSGNIGIGLYMVEYHFTNSEDAVAFRLRWG